MEHRATQHDSPPYESCNLAGLDLGRPRRERAAHFDQRHREADQRTSDVRGGAGTDLMGGRPIRLAKPQRAGRGGGGMASCQRSPCRRTNAPCPRRRRSSSERDLPEGGPQRGSVVDQQFGRARERERAGSTGRTGRSEEEKRLTYRFLMDRPLSCSSLQIRRSEQVREDEAHGL
jgi:hypothetical protein